MEKLVYIHKSGTDFEGVNSYEFIFSNNADTIDGEEWDSSPASGKPLPPDKSFIMSVGVIHTEIKLDLIQDSIFMGMYDAIDGIIAMGWENIDGLKEYPENRMSFFFGEETSSVVSKLNNKNIILEMKKIKNGYKK